MISRALAELGEWCAEWSVKVNVNNIYPFQMETFT